MSRTGNHHNDIERVPGSGLKVSKGLRGQEEPQPYEHSRIRVGVYPDGIMRGAAKPQIKLSDTEGRERERNGSVIRGSHPSTLYVVRHNICHISSPKFPKRRTW